MPRQLESQITTTKSNLVTGVNSLSRENTRYALALKGTPLDTLEWMSSEKAIELLVSKENIEAIPHVMRLYAQCPVCSEIFWKNPSKYFAAKKASKNLKHTCSNECSKKLRSIENSVAVKCHECEIEFKRSASAAKLREEAEQPQFCSNSCYGKHRSKVYVQEKHPHFNSLTLTCTHCSKEFKRKASQVSSTRTAQPFCSRECYYEDMKGKASQKGTGRALRSYPPEFKKARAKMLEEEKSCVVCGVTATILHHADEDKENSAPENLKPTCETCHMKHHLHTPQPLLLPSSG